MLDEPKPGLQSGEQADAMDKLKLAHLGLGKWGFNWATEVLPKHPEVEVVAFVDRDPEARQRLGDRTGPDGNRVFGSLAQALAKTDAEAVSIAVPVALHAAVAAEALAAGKHVLVEKPFTATLAEARQLVSLAAARNLTLMVSQNYRFNPAVRMAADLTRREALGALTSLNIDFRRNAYADNPPNLGVPDPLFGDLAVHHFDLLRMITGADPATVSAHSWNSSRLYVGDPIGTATLNFEGGPVVSYRGSWVDLGPETGWSGEWQMQFREGTIVWTSGVRQSGRAVPDSLTILRPSVPAEVVELPDMPLRDRAGVLSAFVRAVRTGKKAAHFSDGHDNIGTLRIVHATLRSASNGGVPVALDTVA